MGYKKMGDKRPRHRCPECRSTNIYKRSCNYNWIKHSRKKGRHTGNDDENDIIKKYLCNRCRNEFDIALVE